MNNQYKSTITVNSSSLFTALKVGRMHLEHRVVMAPLTRMRSDKGNLVNDLMVEYYTQRASKGGLLISEATPVSLKGYGYVNAPGIYSDAQIDGWKKVTDAVHAKGSYIFLQLWHVGRQSHSDLQPNGQLPVAPSAIQADGHAYSANGEVPFSMPRALELSEIPEIIEEFRLGAVRALAAGFDGVELHGANGYLPDQFLQDGSNKRSDEYGGSIENRAKFMLDLTAAMVSVFGGDRVGVRIAPSGTYGDMHDSDPDSTFGYLAHELNRFGLAYLHIIEPRIKGNEEVEDGRVAVAAAHLRKIYDGIIMAAGGFKLDSATDIIDSNNTDLVAFGRDFIANPDLPKRLKYNLPLNPYDRKTFYGGDARGYTDYPTYQ